MRKILILFVIVWLYYSIAILKFVTSSAAQGDPAAKQEVKRLLGKVHEMQAQRSKLEAQLRDDIHNDDVTKQLVTNQEDMEDFFKTELKKHDKLVSQLVYDLYRCFAVILLIWL